MLSGAMDVVAVGYPDGSMKCSSFHVRFGSLKVLKSKKKRIMIYVNGQKTDVTMRLSGNGDAYFVFEEQDKNDILMKKSHTSDGKFANPFKPLNEISSYCLSIDFLTVSSSQRADSSPLINAIIFSSFF